MLFVHIDEIKPSITDVSFPKAERKTFDVNLSVCFNISCDISPRNNTYVEVKRQQNLRSSTDNISVCADRLDERLERHFPSAGSYLTTQTGFCKLLSSRRAYRINFISHLLMICTDGLNFFPYKDYFVLSFSLENVLTACVIIFCNVINSTNEHMIFNVR